MENHTVLSFKEVNCKRSHKVPSRAFNSVFDLTKSQKSNSELFRNKHEKILSPFFLSQASISSKTFKSISIPLNFLLL